MRLSHLSGHWVLITGASAGIGKAFAQGFAKLGMHVAMVARRRDPLERLQQELTSEHGVETLIITMDLSLSGAIERLHRQLVAQGIHIRVLCNNAGISRWGRFEEGADGEHARMLALNNGAMVAACCAFMPDLASHPTSAVINVASSAGYQPVPYMAVYAASKAFVLSFSQALHGEWRERGVLVQCLVPGPTQSESTRLSPMPHLGPLAPADEVVAASMHGLSRGLPVAVSARGTWKQRLFNALAPPGMLIRAVAKMFDPQLAPVHRRDSELHAQPDDAARKDGGPAEDTC
jgi:short-subunit dehydrogenase